MKSHSTRRVISRRLSFVNRIAQTFLFRSRFGLFLTLPTLALAQTSASDSVSQQAAYRSSIAQESVRKQTDKIQAEITELLAELKLNGMSGADLAVLTNASGHLQDLSQQDMQKVVNALQSASMATQEQGRQQSLVTAYEGQKVVSLKLKALAVDMAAQEAQKEIPSKLENLIARQSANLRLTGTLVRTNADSLNVQQKTTHDVVASEQTALGGEVDVFFTALTAAAAAPTKPATPNAPPDSASAILKAMNGGSLKPVTDAAAQATTAGPFPDAVAKQGDVRNALSSLLRLSLSNLDTVSKLQEVRAELNQITNDQKDLGATAKESKLDGGTLAERQAKIGDRASVTQAVLKAVSPAASTQLTEAQQDIDKSASALAAAKNPADTAPQQQAVVDALVKTAALLDQQIAAAQKAQAEAPTDKLAQLQQLQSEIAQAQQNPQDAASLQKAQQDAAEVSPQAANKLADADDAMQKSDADAAKSDLAQANAAVQQQVDAMKQDAQAYQALAQASQQLATAQKDAAAAQQAMQQQQSSGDLTQAAKDLTQAQQALQQATQTAPSAGAPPDAQQAMQQAAAALQAATNQAVQAQAAGAQAQDQKAQAAMQQAQASLGQAMAQMQQQGQGQGQGPQQQPGQGQGQPLQPGQTATMASNGQAPQDGSGLLGGYGAAGGPGQVMGGLKPKDRDAITQFQAEKSPPEYAPLVQQYLKNLADSGQSK